MKWSKNIDKSKKNSKKEPKLGDYRYKLKYAFFPVKDDNGNSVWLEYYLEVDEYKKIHRMEYYTVSSGLLEDGLTTFGLLNERETSKLVTYQGWYHKRNIFDKSVINSFANQIK